MGGVPIGLCCCRICDKHSECHINECQYCERFNCIVVYDTTSSLAKTIELKILLIQAYVKLLELVDATGDLINTYRIALENLKDQ